MKVGNYGTGRSYSYTTRSSGKNDERNCFIFMGIISFIALGILIYKEYDYS